MWLLNNLQLFKIHFKNHNGKKSKILKNKSKVDKELIKKL